jgi:protein-S-isoprenylcysteine O-methyltransferase Ste14
MPQGPGFYHRLVGLLWGAWALYWLISAAGNKATRRRESLGSRFAHVLPGVAGGVLIAWRSPAWPGWLAARLWPRALLPVWLGLALLAAGLAFSVWARVRLGRNWSGTVTVKEGHELIRTGPYRYVRHPIYTGLLAAVLGTAITSGTVRAALGLVLIVAALCFKLRREERFMSETFPEEYPRYRTEVPALVPFTKLRRSAPR